MSKLPIFIVGDSSNFIGYEITQQDMDEIECNM